MATVYFSYLSVVNSTVFIVLLCRYSTRATKIFGNNAVAVLTTLFFLSYTKLLRNNVLILGAAGLRQFNPVGYYAAWRLDSNIEYFGNPHAFLFLTAVAVSIFLYLPLNSNASLCGSSSQATLYLCC